MPLQASPFFERLLRYLIPYFTGVTPDLQAARAEALETLASYGARTRGELMNVVQVIILGFSTLETLSEATAGEMSPSMRLRFRGCANNLSRNGQKTEQTLMKRLARDVPIPTPLTTEPVADLPEPQVEETLRATQAKIDTTRNRLSGARPSHNPQPPLSQADNNKRLWGSVMMDTLAEMGMPVQPAPPPDAASHSQRGSSL